MPKVALAYSGSLDTTICVYFLKNIKGFRVFTFSANLGQTETLEPLVEKAMQLGAAAAHIADLRQKFVEDYVWPCVRAQAIYEGHYFLFSALARPLIVQELVNIAQEEGCDYVAHGSRGTGNDMVRIQNAMAALAPDLKVIAPLQELRLAGPEQDLEYAKSHRIKFDEPRRTIYNIEQNLWGVNVQLRGAQDPWSEPPADTYFLTSPPSETAPKPGPVEIEFESGTPTKLNGEELGGVDLVEQLNSLGGRHGIGRIDALENRISGLKTREIYESPAGFILYTAHRALQRVVLDRETLHALPELSRRYADLVYEGKWFHPLRRALDALFADVNRQVTGSVRLSLYRGRASVTGIQSPNSLFPAPRP
jgi:argininosuccinate synthase